MNRLVALIARDLKLSVRQRADTLLTIAFFAVVVILFPFGIGPEPSVLERISAGVLWVTALLSAILSLDRLFADDFADGTLDLLVAAPGSATTTAAAKIVVHWLTSGLPLLILAPLLGVVLNLPAGATPTLIAALALGTPTLSLIGAVGAALTLGARQAGVLLALIVLPLTVPVLIFGVGAVDAAAMGFAANQPLMVLGGFFLIALVLCPWGTAVGLRHAVE